MSFGADVSDWADDAAQRMADSHRQVTLRLFRAIILQTPVGNPDNWQNPGSAPDGYVGGRLRGNWQISSNSPADGTVNIIDPSGRRTVAKITRFLTSLNFEKDVNIYLANNLPYAYTIEHDGHSDQAPEGMLRKNLIRISNSLSQL